MSGSGLGHAAAAITLVVFMAGCSVAATLAPAASGAASSGSPTTAASTATPWATSFATTAAPASATGSGGRLIVLADGPDGGPGLWALGSDSRWTSLAATPGATAMGRYGEAVAIATGAGVEVRRGPDFSIAATSTTLKWPGGTPTPIVADLDVAAGGRTALVTSNGGTYGYAVVGTDGTVTPLTPAPTQPFTPIVSWIDGSRLLVLSTDNLQESRLAVVDPVAHTIDSARAPAGVHFFAVSSDGKTVAAATENAIYAGPLAAFTRAAAPAPIATLADAQVVWALALDESGSKLFMLSGLLGSDGTVGTVHEVGYTRSGPAWTRFLDSGVPFGRAIDQVYLP